MVCYQPVVSGILETADTRRVCREKTVDLSFAKGNELKNAERKTRDGNDTEDLVLWEQISDLSPQVIHFDSWWRKDESKIRLVYHFKMRVEY